MAATPTTAPAAVTPPERSRVTYDSYILGPGESLQIELLDIPELSGRFTIGPDGTIYLPRLRALYVEGLTVEELRYFLTEQFKTYVKSPELYVRPIRIYVGAEVRRPGYYTLSGSQELGRLSDTAEDVQLEAGTATASTRPGLNQVPGGISGSGSGLSTYGALFPTVFDAIRTAKALRLSQTSPRFRSPASRPSVPVAAGFAPSSTSSP